jgi:hypothetical protein
VGTFKEQVTVIAANTYVGDFKDPLDQHLAGAFKAGGGA